MASPVAVLLWPRRGPRARGPLRWIDPPTTMVRVSGARSRGWSADPISGAVYVCSARRDFARPAACGDCGGGCTVFTSTTASTGTRSRLTPRAIWRASACAGLSTLTAAAGEEPVLRNGAVLLPAQGCGSHAGFRGRACPGQAADPGAVPERGGVGAGGLWSRGGEPRNYYRVPARRIGREQAALLAAVLPAPLKRRPERMNSHSEIISGADAADGVVEGSWALVPGCWFRVAPPSGATR